MVAAALLFIAAPVHATPSPYLSAQQLEQYAPTIKRIEEYLSAIETLRANFSQTAPDGSITTGVFSMKRPGKMRWQYAPPSPILMISDGEVLTFYDKDLEQVSYIPLDDTMLSFISNDKITFGDNVGIESITDKAGLVRITISQRKKPSEGALSLEFSDKPLQLRNIITRDASGQTTTVGLYNMQTGLTLNKDTFEFVDPRKKKR